LISEHDKKFSLLTIGSVFDDPRRDLKVERVVLNALSENAALPHAVCAFGGSFAIVFRRSRSTLATSTQ
jgi:hypothetical protein